MINFKILLLILTLIGSNSIFAQDYNIYHSKIIHAEEEIFQKGRAEIAISIYSDVFKKFDFVFLRDCIIAMQIALYNNDEKFFLEFIFKASKNGLSQRSLSELEYVTQHALYKKNISVISQNMLKNRDNYLQQIDTVALKEIIRLFAFDQIDKGIIPAESGKQHDLRYKPLIQETYSKLMLILNSKGFPGDKLIGVDQNDIMSELHIGKYDIMDYFNKYKNDQSVHIVALQFMLEENLFSSTLYFPILIHFANFWNDKSNKRKYVLYSDEYFQKQITKGNIHPQDVAYLFDLGCNFTSTPILDTIKGEKYFGIRSAFSTSNKSDTLLDSQMNRFRVAFHIISIQCQRAKINFMRKHGMHYSFGWDRCRS